jgi:hypothetical protein
MKVSDKHTRRFAIWDTRGPSNRSGDTRMAFSEVRIALDALRSLHNRARDTVRTDAQARSPSIPNMK